MYINAYEQHYDVTILYKPSATLECRSSGPHENRCLSIMDFCLASRATRLEKNEKGLHDGSARTHQ